MTKLLSSPSSEDLNDPAEPMTDQLHHVAAKEDGRSMRRHRNREAVIRALIDLIREGDLTPTVGKIADRAELSHRSVFRYFDDLDDMARAAIETEFRESWPLSVVADVGQGALEDRIDRLVDARLQILQRTHLLALVARARSQEIDDVREGVAYIFQLHLDQVRENFAPELGNLESTDADAIATSIAITTWLDSYDLLRRTMGRSVDEIASTWRTTIATLLA